jgi:hypothetical protein
VKSNLTRFLLKNTWSSSWTSFQASCVGFCPSKISFFKHSQWSFGIEDGKKGMGCAQGMDRGCKRS